MFRLDPKQAVLDHVAATNAARNGPVVLTEAAERIAAAPIEPTYSGTVIVGIAQAIEALLLATLGFAIYGTYVGGGQEAFYIPVIMGAVLFANVAFNAARTHRIPAYRTVVSQLGRALAAWSVTFIALLLVAFLFKATEEVSRVWLVGWYAGGAVALIAFRLSLRYLVWQWTAEGRLKRRTVIVGGGKDAETLIEAIRGGKENDLTLIGLFDDRVDDRSPGCSRGAFEAGQGCRPHRVRAPHARRSRDRLDAAAARRSRVLDMLKQLWVLPVDIRLSAHMSKLRFTSKAYSYVGDLPVFDMADRPLSDWNLVFKWVFDKVVAVFALILLSPVMVATAIAVKLESKGPVFFKQKRHGFNNQLIEMYKFRSMYTDMSDANAVKLVTKDDPRVTRVGRFIRKTSIDELPQLFNVLKGELSIVGPRPHALQAKAANKLYYEAVEGYFARHKVKPGMTGWAQIKGWRGETDTLEKIMQRVNHDLYYIENWSILLDFYICIMTPVSLLSKRQNAY